MSDNSKNFTKLPKNITHEPKNNASKRTEPSENQQVKKSVSDESSDKMKGDFEKAKHEQIQSFNEFSKTLILPPAPKSRTSNVSGEDTRLSPLSIPETKHESPEHVNTHHSPK